MGTQIKTGLHIVLVSKPRRLLSNRIQPGRCADQCRALATKISVLLDDLDKTPSVLVCSSPVLQIDGTTLAHLNTKR